MPPTEGDIPPTSASVNTKKKTIAYRVLRKLGKKKKKGASDSDSVFTYPNDVATTKNRQESVYSSSNMGIKITSLKKKEKRKRKMKASMKGKSSWLSKTVFFQDMCNTAFETIDQDGSGSIDEKELYSGLLLIHLKLGSYAGPAACKVSFFRFTLFGLVAWPYSSFIFLTLTILTQPVDREKCRSIFLKMDADGSGSLDKEEFQAVMMVLFGNVMMRVAFQYACTLLIVPFIAKVFLDLVLQLSYKAYEFVSTLDEHSEYADVIGTTILEVWTNAIEYWGAWLSPFVAQASDFWSANVPPTVIETLSEILSSATTTLQGCLDAIPDSVWATIPLTLISTILSMMIIPWSLMKIDDYFQAVAGSENKSKLKTN